MCSTLTPNSSNHVFETFLKLSKNKNLSQNLHKYKHNANHIGNLKISSSHITKKKKNELSFKNILLNSIYQKYCNCNIYSKIY